MRLKEWLKASNKAFIKASFKVWRAKRLSKCGVQSIYQSVACKASIKAWRAKRISKHGAQSAAQNVALKASINASIKASIKAWHAKCGSKSMGHLWRARLGTIVTKKSALNFMKKFIKFRNRTTTQRGENSHYSG
jgi:hypothetical protein